MNDSNASGNDVPSLSSLQAARLDNLRKIEQLGYDPWGSKFDQREMIGTVRNRCSEVKYQLKDGTQVSLPDLDADRSIDYAAWKKDQGEGDEIGPNVRVAGRVILYRDTGKLIFVKLRDWTGDVQIFIGKGQVGDEGFALAKLVDLGDLIGVDGRLGRTNKGELTVFASKLHFHCKSMEPPPEKHAGLTDPELRQRLRYLDLTYNEGV
ncbi:MAG: Lysine--tRNA ligase, partial [Planctomycetota bacterium]